MEQPKPTRDSEEIKENYIRIKVGVNNNAEHLEKTVYIPYVAHYKQKLSDYNQQLTKLFKE